MILSQFFFDPGTHAAPISFSEPLTFLDRGPLTDSATTDATWYLH